MPATPADAMAETVDYVGPVAPLASVTNLPTKGGTSPRVAVVQGHAASLTAETPSLLRRRLRAAAWFMLVVSTVVFTRNLWIGHDPARVPQILLLLVEAGAIAVLSGRRALTLRQLRLIEFTLFGLVALYLAVRQYHMEALRAEQEDAVGLLAQVKDTIIAIFGLMVLYTMLVPTTAGRAARMVVPMALTPLAVLGLLVQRHPKVVAVASQIASFELVTSNVFALLSGAGLAIYGAHVIHSLREEVFSARQFGQYQLGRRLGSGGMGEVFLAEHRLMKRPCAIKLIRAQSAGDPAVLARFEREVRATARLSHPNTIEIYDYGRTVDGTFYYVMEYLRGLSLAELVSRHGPLAPGRVIYLLRQVCQALGEAHAMGLIHRDIKPANIFAARRGGMWDVAKLLDFGLVKQTEESPTAELSADGAISGSPLYMSPEQATGDCALDPRTDIYGLGAVAYFLLTGRPPFEGGTVMAVMIAHARDPVVPPSSVAGVVPPDLESIILRCLEKDPSARFPSAEGLERALAGCTAAGEWDARRAARWWSELEQGGQCATGFEP